MRSYLRQVEDFFNRDRTGFLLVCLTVLVFIINIRYLGSIGILTALEDEFGYWGNAAYLAGLDWSDAISNIPYYSYGYSLLLVPLFWIFDNPVHMYRAAVVLNGLLLSASFLLCYDLARKLMSTANRYVLIAIAFLISMYPAYLAYSSVALAECLLIFTCWLLTWCFAGVNEKSSNYRFILIGLLSVYVYMVHQRTLGILMASLLVILLMKVFNNINWKQLFYVLVPAALLAVIHFYLKNDILTHLWLTSGENLANDYSTQFSKVGQLFSVDGLVRAFKLFMGQLFYIGAASYLLCYFGLYELAQKIRAAITTATKNHDLNLLRRDKTFYLYTFLILAVLFSMAISATYLIHPTRTDHLVYGRYVEMILGPIILLGFVNLTGNKTISTRRLLSLLAGFAILTVVVSMIIANFNFGASRLINTTGVVFMNTPWGIYLPALVAILACSIMFIYIKRGSHKKIMAATILTTLLFFFTGEAAKRYIVLSNQSMLEIAEIADFITGSEANLPIYFLWDDQVDPAYDKWDVENIQDRLIADCYQFLFKEKSLSIVNKAELNGIAGDKFVLSAEVYELFDLMDNYTFCMSNAYSYLLVPKISPFACGFIALYPRNAIRIPLEIFNLTHAVGGKNYVQGDGTPGFFMEGFNKRINAGKYEFIVELEIIEHSKDDLGYADVYYSGDQAKKVLTRKSIKADSSGAAGTLLWEVPFTLEEDTDDIGFRIHATKGTRLKIHNVFIREQEL